MRSWRGLEVAERTESASRGCAVWGWAGRGLILLESYAHSYRTRSTIRTHSMSLHHSDGMRSELLADVGLQRGSPSPALLVTPHIASHSPSIVSSMHQYEITTDIILHVSPKSREMSVNRTRTSDSILPTIARSLVVSITIHRNILISTPTGTTNICQNLSQTGTHEQKIDVQIVASSFEPLRRIYMSNFA